MAKRPKRPRDVNQLAKLILDIATGEAENVKPVAPKGSKQKGGTKGGVRRAVRLTADQRREIAQTAARARWKKPPG